MVHKDLASAIANAKGFISYFKPKDSSKSKERKDNTKRWGQPSASKDNG